jgi:hypothetical protein
MGGAQTAFDQAKAAGKSDSQALETVVAWLLDLPDVASAKLSSDPTIVEFAFRDGTPGLFLGAPAWSESVAEGKEPALRGLAFPMGATQPGRKAALILDPFPRFYDRSPSRVKSMLESIGYTSQYLREEMVTLTALRSISNYGVIMISTHGGLVSGEVALLSGETATAENWKTYETWRMAGKVGIAGHGGGFWPWDKREWWFVTPSFFEDLPRADESLFYAYACHSLEGSTMADALQRTGVAAYVGWNRIAFAGFESGVPRRFFASLCEYQTVAEADLADGSSAATYVGNGDLVLATAKSLTGTWTGTGHEPWSGLDYEIVGEFVEHSDRTVTGAFVWTDSRGGSAREAVEGETDGRGHVTLRGIALYDVTNPPGSQYILGTYTAELSSDGGRLTGRWGTDEEAPFELVRDVGGT